MSPLSSRRSSNEDSEEEPNYTFNPPDTASRRRPFEDRQVPRNQSQDPLDARAMWDYWNCREARDNTAVGPADVGNRDGAASSSNRHATEEHHNEQRAEGVEMITEQEYGTRGVSRPAVGRSLEPFSVSAPDWREQAIGSNSSIPSTDHTLLKIGSRFSDHVLPYRAPTLEVLDEGHERRENTSNQNPVRSGDAWNETVPSANRSSAMPVTVNQGPVEEENATSTEHSADEEQTHGGITANNPPRLSEAAVGEAGRGIQPATDTESSGSTVRGQQPSRQPTADDGGTGRTPRRRQNERRHHQRH